MTSEQMRKLVGVQNNGSTWFMLATLAHSHTYLADMLSTQTGDNKYIHMYNVDIANRIYGNIHTTNIHRISNTITRSKDSKLVKNP